VDRLKVVADTGPLLAAAYRNDPAHKLAWPLVTALGRNLVVLDPVLVEADHLLCQRSGPYAARALLTAMVAGEHSAAFLSPGLLHRAIEIDAQHADLDLGLVDASVMAYAERHELPILTFDFVDFRAARPAQGHWRLVIDEARYADAVS
jgi:predicted nucleic acid-binding protein